MINALGYTVTYGPGSFANPDGSVPTQMQVDEAFNKFKLEIDRRNSSAKDEDIALLILPKRYMKFSEPVLSIYVVVPQNDNAKQRVIDVTDEFAAFVNESGALKFDPKNRMIV